MSFTHVINSKTIQIDIQTNKYQFAQELLSTFGTDLGEVSLVPVTGGVFSVTIWHAERTSRSGPSTGEVSTREVLLWDRGNDGGFPGALSFLLLSLLSWVVRGREFLRR